MSSGITNIFSTGFLFPLFTLAFYAIALVICFDCIWRVQKRIDLFLKIIAAAMIVTVIRIILGLVGLSESAQWQQIIWISDLLEGILFLSAMIVMIRTIRSLNLEKPRKK